MKNNFIVVDDRHSRTQYLVNVDNICYVSRHKDNNSALIRIKDGSRIETVEAYQDVKDMILKGQGIKID